ncbi:Small integral membrane protein 24, partial [Lemmus lemmus]
GQATGGRFSAPLFPRPHPPCLNPTRASGRSHPQLDADLSSASVMDTLGRLLLLAALLLAPAEAQQATERRLKPWLVGLAAVVGFLFVVFVLLLANRVWCSKPRLDDEEVRVRMEPTENEYTEPRYPVGDHTLPDSAGSKIDKKKQKRQVEKKDGHSNEGLELDEKDSSDDERSKKTVL